MKKVRSRRKRRLPGRRKRRSLILLLSLLILACLGMITKKEVILDDQNFDEISPLEVHYLDVGQGDCALVMCDGHVMLIDAGDGNQGTKIQAYLKKRGIEKLDYLVLTHPDADHIGGAPVIITKFEIEQVFMTDYPKETATYEKVLDALEYKYLKWSMPAVESTYTLGSARITFLGPQEKYEESNNSSLILSIEHGKNKFLFTGDAEEDAEEDFVEAFSGNGHAKFDAGDAQLLLQADVLKLGHHGSKTSTGEILLDAVNPQFAVISCSEGNSYGFPHAQTLNNLRKRGIQVFRTDEQGSIVATSDGVTLSWNCAPSTTWQTGQ